MSDKGGPSQGLSEEDALAPDGVPQRYPHPTREVRSRPPQAHVGRGRAVVACGGSRPSHLPQDGAATRPAGGRHHWLW